MASPAWFCTSLELLFFSAVEMSLGIAAELRT